MKLKGKLPPSRQGKKQIIAFVAPEVAEQVALKARREEKTNQEIIAEALNRVLKAHDRDPIFTAGHSRIVRRRKGASKARSAANAPSCRVGKRPVGGWFEEEKVQQVYDFSREVDLSIQKMLETGLKDVTGMQPIPAGPEEVA